jgi:hypothetical protein
MKTETLDLVAIDEAHDAAWDVFRARKAEWIAAGRPEKFPPLETAAGCLARRNAELRYVLTARAEVKP